MSTDLEMLREIFKDNRLHNGLGTIKKISLSKDNSELFVQVNLIPENREVIAKMSWADVSWISFPEVDDLVLTASVDGHPDETYVTRYLSTKDELIPLLARSGHLVVYSRPGKKAYLGSDTKVGIGKLDSDQTEPLVLGNVFKTFMSAILDAIISHTHTSAPPGIITSPPLNAATFTAQKASPITDNAILSGIAFTEK